MAMATCPAPAAAFGQAPKRMSPGGSGRVITLPVTHGFVWPRFQTFHLYESGGSLREASSALGFAAISVADRPTTRSISPGCMHVQGTVQDFVATYPHPMPLVTTHVNCGNANRASYTNWRDRVRDGMMLRNGEELVWAMALGQDNASEQPFTAYEFLVGPPAFITTTLDHWDGSNDLVPHKTWLL